ncbi:hypothetical protein DRO24_00335 [Candidatus Bathyarchaeota archaeon]|nr:MAG: hypothetical protein DRO24_00335 [Candidatus Bathyarchaeota archaeon]
MSQTNLIQLDENGNIPKDARPKKKSDDLKYLNGVAFFTQQGAAVKVRLLQNPEGKRIVVISKGKQYFAIMEADVEKLLKAIDQVFKYEVKSDKT